MATIRIGVTVAESSLAMQAVLPSGVTAMAWGDSATLIAFPAAPVAVNGYLIGARAGAYYSSAASAADGGGLVGVVVADQVQVPPTMAD